MKLAKKHLLKQKRKWRIRKKIKGTADRPRLSLAITNKHIYAQCIDDVAGKTICAVSSLDKGQNGTKNNVEGAAVMGKAFAEKASSAGIKSVVFDRNGRAFHGAVKAFAESARSVLEF